MLRADGAERVVLVGASIGGTASLVAAAQIEPRVDGVVSLSAVNVLSVIPDPDVTARRAVRQLRMPVLLVSTEDDPSVNRG